MFDLVCGKPLVFREEIWRLVFIPELDFLHESYVSELPTGVLKELVYWPYSVMRGHDLHIQLLRLANSVVKHLDTSIVEQSPHV